MKVTETADTKEAVNSINNQNKQKQDDARPYVPLAGAVVADTNDVKKMDTLVKEATDAKKDRTVVDTKGTEVRITSDDKLAFLKAIATGERYVSTVSLFGGKVKVKFRSRSVGETEAIIAYMHRNGMAGKFITKADVSDTSLAALLVAQVAELNDVAYPEMKKPLKYTETLDGIKEPAWVEDMDMWLSKPEALLAALGEALVEFEAKYWHMVGASRLENFWNPGGSTGK